MCSMHQSRSVSWRRFESRKINKKTNVCCCCTLRTACPFDQVSGEMSCGMRFKRQQVQLGKSNWIRHLDRGLLAIFPFLRARSLCDHVWYRIPRPLRRRFGAGKWGKRFALACELLVLCVLLVANGTSVNWCEIDKLISGRSVQLWAWGFISASGYCVWTSKTMTL